MATGIIGTGSFLPPTIIDNNELAKLVKTRQMKPHLLWRQRLLLLQLRMQELIRRRLI